MENKLPVTRYISKYFPPIVTRDSIDFSTYPKRLEEALRLMQTEGRWFEDGHNYNFRPATTKNIILGRYQFYIQFADFMNQRYGIRSYLLNFMTRYEDGLQSLLFYIESAERIDINLEGVNRRHLGQATIGLGRLANHMSEIEAPYATAWEINQVFYRNHLKRTWFHTGREMSRRQAFLSMGRVVSRDRIRNDNRWLLADYKRENKDLIELQ
jgi:hypothetical protein